MHASICVSVYKDLTWTQAKGTLTTTVGRCLVHATICVSVYRCKDLRLSDFCHPYQFWKELSKEYKVTPWVSQ